jgi:hypothetical protein
MKKQREARHKNELKNSTTLELEYHHSAHGHLRGIFGGNPTPGYIAVYSKDEKKTKKIIY